MAVLRHPSPGDTMHAWRAWLMAPPPSPSNAQTRRGRRGGPRRAPSSRLNPALHRHPWLCRALIILPPP
ncbi:hypothetical protein B296_00036310 [Ensete ventricosum]|uniref:Uncharacterized protein n=1 Tax=Ensete ventricosum TaxID=4639 RepID=A0A426ZTW1_ENSVE|nr:hypothetical protein B296_00036310 [Ensete ventricosum]